MYIEGLIPVQKWFKRQRIAVAAGTFLVCLWWLGANTHYFTNGLATFGLGFIVAYIIRGIAKRVEPGMFRDED